MNGQCPAAIPHQPIMTPVLTSSDLLRQQQMVHALCGYILHPIQIEETHISWVLLIGSDAYKIKKSLNLGFLDFSTLELRHYYCLEELRLNRRLAPDLYLDVIPIGGSLEQPLLGNEPAIEYAVHMRRFTRSCRMDRLLENGCVTSMHIDKLAAMIAGFHAALTPAAADSPYCSTAAIQDVMLQNFSHELLRGTDLKLLETVRDASMQAFVACEPLFRQRAAAGFVRECHGDLHLGNVVLLDDAPIPFDGIEFNAGLRWIDVISEISFMVMDLLQRDQPQLAWRFLNAYLESSGDYAGMGVLRFYLAYRAMVRAKVAAIRASQEGIREVEREMSACRSYLGLAHDCLIHRRPALIITHGLPGCGKSTFAQIALERLGAIRIRSDVERKRLFGLDALAGSNSLIGADIYGEDATRSTYARLHELARAIIAAGLTVIVDAAFLRHAERESFRALATEMAAPCVIVSLQADDAVLAGRLAERASRGNDASEADISVMRKLQSAQEMLNAQELDDTVAFVNNGDGLQSAADSWAALEARLMPRW